jgi:hypothetical protein
MRNFLQICQDVLRETGVSGVGPVSVGTATGIEKKIVGYVIQAWIDVQTCRDDWPWMFKEFSFETSPMKQRYPCVELNLTDVEKWDLDGAGIYKTIDGKRAESFLGSKTYDNWWKNNRIGERLPATPESIFVDPATNDLMVYPVPDDEYTISLRYYKAAQRLAADLDIPFMPTNEAWKDIIMWKALWYYGYYDGAPSVLSEADLKYNEAIHALDNRMGSIISISAEPIA